jgi:hypothetical protein
LSPRAPIGPPPPPGWTPPVPPAEPVGEPPRKGAGGSEDYASMSLPKLKRLAAKNKAANDALLRRYETMPDEELRLERSDERGWREWARRYPSDELAYQKALESKRPPHSATAVARVKARPIWSAALTSGNETAEEKAMAPLGLATHTEHRACRQAPLGRGVVLSISGQYDPCPNCQRFMQETATRTGATIIYWWPSNKPGGETRVFRP